MNTEKNVTEIRDRFELIILASTRTLELDRGLKHKLSIKKQKQKSVITALEEISSGKIDIMELRKSTFINYKYKGAQPYKEQKLEKSKNGEKDNIYNDS